MIDTTAWHPANLTITEGLFPRGNRNDCMGRVRRRGAPHPHQAMRVRIRNQKCIRRGAVLPTPAYRIAERIERGRGRRIPNETCRSRVKAHFIPAWANGPGFRIEETQD